MSLKEKIVKKVKAKMEGKTSWKDVDWDKMFSKWKGLKEDLSKKLKNLGDPPKEDGRSDKALKKWTEDFMLLKYNMDILAEEADKFNKKYGFKLEDK